MEGRKKTLTAHIAHLSQHIEKKRTALQDAVYGTSDRAGTELAQLDTKLAVENDALRNLRESAASHTTLASELRFALNSIVLDFLGVDCAIHDDVDVIAKLMVG